MVQFKKEHTQEKYEMQLPVQEKDEGLRLDQFAQTYLHSLSREHVKRKIDKGEIVIEGRTPPHKASVKVHAGENVIITTYRFVIEEWWRGESISMTEEPKIIFENHELLVVNKPPFMATHPTGRHLFYTATSFYEDKYGQTIHSIHRLDRETSGVLLLGKDPQISKQIGLMFENDQVQKCYFLIAKKIFPKFQFPLDAYESLGQKEDFIPRTFTHCFPKGSEQGKDAYTHFELLAENENYLVALAFPKTGRQHQIRAHAAFHGFPLLGDKLYNGDPTIFMRFKDEEQTDEDYDLMEMPRHALHAFGLKMPYPTKEDPSLYISHLPADLIEWLEKHPDFNEKEIVDIANRTVKDYLEK